MKIMINTNVIISVALFPNGKAAKAFLIFRDMTIQRSSC